MVSDGRGVVTESETRRRKADAVYAQREAQQELNFLCDTAEEMGCKLSKVAVLFRDVKASQDRQRLLTQILQLADMEYGEMINLAAVKALANTLVTAERTLREASQKVQDIGA